MHGVLVAKHVSKSKRTRKDCRFGTLFEAKMLKKCAPLWHEANFEAHMPKTPHVRSLGSWALQKARAAVARSTCRSEDGNHHMFGPVLHVRRRSVWQAQWIVFLDRSEPNLWGLKQFTKQWQAWGHLKSVCKDGFRVAGAVQETSPSGMLGQGQGAEFPERASGLQR